MLLKSFFMMGNFKHTQIEHDEPNAPHAFQQRSKHNQSRLISVPVPPLLSQTRIVKEVQPFVSSVNRTVFSSILTAFLRIP